MKGSRQFSAELSELDHMMKWVREILAQFAVAERAKKFELAIEEALVNVINYAYPSYPSGVVEVLYSCEAGKLDVVIKDQGWEFNPLENPKPINKHAPIEERDAGGLGIHFILSMTDSASYKRSDGWNILTLSQNTTRLSYQ